MAGLEAGTLSKFDCNKCLQMPERKKLFGCTERAPRPAMTEWEGGKFYRYFNCPLRFIPQNVIDFVRVYKYLKDFPSASMPTFYECSGRFVLAYQYFEAKKAEYSREITEKEKLKWQTQSSKLKRG